MRMPHTRAASHCGLGDRLLRGTHVEHARGVRLRLANIVAFYSLRGCCPPLLLSAMTSSISIRVHCLQTISLCCVYCSPASMVRGAVSLEILPELLLTTSPMPRGRMRAARSHLCFCFWWQRNAGRQSGVVCAAGLRPNTRNEEGEDDQSNDEDAAKECWGAGSLLGWRACVLLRWLVIFQQPSRCPRHRLQSLRVPGRNLWKLVTRHSQGRSSPHHQTARCSVESLGRDGVHLPIHGEQCRRLAGRDQHGPI